MPYITRKDKDRLNEGYNTEPQTAGELNYCITILIRNYFALNHNYQGINDIVGALEAAKSEFQRRVVAPYEDTKIQANGDVY